MRASVHRERRDRERLRWRRAADGDGTKRGIAARVRGGTRARGGGGFV